MLRAGRYSGYPLAHHQVGFFFQPRRSSPNMRQPPMDRKNLHTKRQAEPNSADCDKPDHRDFSF
jgi:hypothetical protein